MKPSPFEYHRPATVAEATSLLAELDEAKVLAGGQSLVPLMNFRLAAPEHLVDISGLEELRSIDVTDDAVVVGAAVTHAELEHHDGAAAVVPLLREAERLIAHEVIRNRGTVCGSLAHADPSGELTAVLPLLGGSVEAVSSRGQRTIDAIDLCEGPLQSCLAEDELLVLARFPRPPETARTSFVEVARRHGDYAVCGVAALADYDGSQLSEARLSFISIAPTPLVLDVTEVVAGRTPHEIDKADVFDFVTAAVDPPSDIHASADYRRHLAGVLSCKALAA